MLKSSILKKMVPSMEARKQTRTIFGTVSKLMHGITLKIKNIAMKINLPKKPKAKPTQFSSLPRELRDMIWGFALCPVHNRHVMRYIPTFKSPVWVGSPNGTKYVEPGGAWLTCGPEHHLWYDVHAQRLANIRNVSLSCREAYERCKYMYVRLPMLDGYLNASHRVYTPHRFSTVVEALPCRDTWVCPKHDFFVYDFHSFAPPFMSESYCRKKWRDAEASHQQRHLSHPRDHDGELYEFMAGDYERLPEKMDRISRCVQNVIIGIHVLGCKSPYLRADIPKLPNLKTIWIQVDDDLQYPNEGPIGLQPYDRHHRDNSEVVELGTLSAVNLAMRDTEQPLIPLSSELMLRRGHGEENLDLLSEAFVETMEMFDNYRFSAEFPDICKRWAGDFKMMRNLERTRRGFEIVMTTRSSGSKFIPPSDVRPEVPWGPVEGLMWWLEWIHYGGLNIY